MPKLYTDILNKCVEEKNKLGKIDDKQYKECQKMAAIVYFKKTGKPIKKEADARFFEVATNQIDDELIDIDGLTLETLGDKVIAKVQINTALERIALGELQFRQPFTKQEVNYQKSEDHEHRCLGCAHYKILPVNMFGFTGLCHLVQGLLKDDYVCDYHTRHLVMDTDYMDTYQKEKAVDSIDD